MSELSMSNEELLASFNQAKNRPNQVKILAELNATTVEDIKQRLLAKGADDRQMPRRKKAAGGRPKAAKARECYPVHEALPAGTVSMETVILGLRQELERLDEAERRMADRRCALDEALKALEDAYPAEDAERGCL